MNSAADIAARFGLKRSGREWRGNCPVCGYGAGAFSLMTSKTGRVIGWCSSCQDRDAINRALHGQPMACPTPAQAARVAAARERNQARALTLWRGSEPVPGTPAARYLTARGLSGMAASTALRFRRDTPHPNAGKLLALIALVSDRIGNPLGIHRTFLTLDGHKAGVEPVKASLGPIWGGAIRLCPIQPGTPLLIGEGIETAGAASLLTGWPAWAALSAGNMAKGLALPAEAQQVVIAADPDPPGRAAAWEAWGRWRAEGRDVRVALPNGSDDFNDLICREVRHAL